MWGVLPSPYGDTLKIVKRKPYIMLTIIMGVLLDILSIQIKSNSYYYSGMLRNDLFRQHEDDSLIIISRCILTYCIYIFLDEIFQSLSTTLYSSAFNQVSSELSIKLSDKLNHLDITKRAVKSNNEWSQIINDSCNEANALNQSSLRLARNTGEMVYFSYNVYSFDKLVINTVAVTALSICKFTLSTIRNSYIKRFDERRGGDKVNAKKLISEALSLHELILSKSTQDLEREKLLQMTNIINTSTSDYYHCRLKFDLLQSSLNFISLATCLSISSAIAQSLRGNELVSFQNLLMLLLSIERNTNNIINDFNTFYESMHRLTKLRNNFPNITRNIVNQSEMTLFSPSIVFRNVTFNVDSRVILNNLSFHIGSGEKVAITGKIGIGKSTIAKLIMKFYDLNGGSITINNTDISIIPDQLYRKHIGYSPQNIYILSDTIFNNIAYGHSNISLKMVKAAAKKSRIHNFIMSLPSKYNEVLYNQGEMLSGGQKQLLAFARIFLRKYELYILDEPTSSIDIYNKEPLIATLAKHIKGTTTIIITHDPDLANISNRTINLNTFTLFKKDLKFNNHNTTKNKCSTNTI